MTSLVIARREFLERVRTRWFVVVTHLGPVMMAALIFIPAFLAERAARTRVRIVVVGEAGLADNVAAGLRLADATFDASTAPPATAEESLLGQVSRREIAGYLLLPADLLDGGKLIYRGENASNLGQMARLNAGVQVAVMRARAERMGLPDDTVARLLLPVPLAAEHTTGAKATASGTGAFLLGYVVMMVLYSGILLYAVHVMRGVLVEKTNRVVEIIVSSVRSESLLAGKILGVGSVGLLQLGIWAGVAAVLARFRGGILAAFGVSGVSGLSIPPITAGTVALLLGYFLLGYFLYASLYAAVGAMCTSEQEAQQAQTPVVLFLVVPVLFVQQVSGDPRGGAAAILTQIPFFSPVLMPLRHLLGGATAGEVVASILGLAATIVVVAWLAARVYRVGILATGRRPRARELLRWIRHA